MELHDYVLATKYTDGDPDDDFAIGFLTEIYVVHDLRCYIVVDDNGRPFRANGFQRCEAITAEEGRWLLSHFPEIMAQPLVTDDNDNVISGRSVWGWLREARDLGTP
jgi:hypothetical protein